LGASAPKPHAFRVAKAAHKNVVEAPPFLLTRRRFLSGALDERGVLDRIKNRAFARFFDCV
jgi:hypothetical protein